MSPEELAGIHYPPPDEGEDFIDRSAMADWESTDEPLTSIYTLPAQGLDELERDRFGFHVVNADENSGLNLNEAFGKETTMLVNGDSFVPEHFIHHLDIMSKRGKEPVRVVFRNLGGMHHGAVHEIEKFFDRTKGFPIKSMYFIDEGDDIEEAVRGKLLMQCDEIVDAATLLDAAAFGWGAKNPYDGVPVGGEKFDYTDGGEQSFSTMEATGLTIARDNLLLEMDYSELEKKFIRLGLDPAAQGREVGTSAEKLFRSLKKRGVTPDEMMDTPGRTPPKTYSKKYSSTPPAPPPPKTPFLTKEDWLGLKRLDKIWCHSHLPAGMVVLRYQIISNDTGKVTAYNMQNFTQHELPFYDNLWHMWERAGFWR